VLASLEGVFCEPASAACVAGLIKLLREGKIKEGRIVCTLTGNGLKDPDTAISVCEDPIEVPPVLERVVEEMGIG